MSTDSTAPSSDALKMARDDFNSFMEGRVRPSLNLSTKDEESLTESQLADRISDPDVRNEFVRKAIAMLEANVAHYEPLGQPLQTSQHFAPMPVVVSLVAAAAGYYFGGPVIALLFAAAGYWFAHRSAVTKLAAQRREAGAHNSEAPDWAKTIEDWKVSIRELRGREA